MGLVSQEPVLFNETIRANIAYGKEGSATETEILAAAELANAHKFISALERVHFLIPKSCFLFAKSLKPYLPPSSMFIYNSLRL